MRTKICAHVQREEQSARQTQRRERERGGGTRERVTAAAAAAAASAAAALLPKQSAYVGAYSNSHKARAGASERKRTQGRRRRQNIIRTIISIDQVCSERSNQQGRHKGEGGGTHKKHKET